MLPKWLRERERGRLPAAALETAAYGLSSLHPAMFFELNVGTQTSFLSFSNDGALLLYVSMRKSVAAVRTAPLPNIDHVWTVASVPFRYHLLSTSFVHEIGGFFLLGSFKRQVGRPNALFALAGVDRTGNVGECAIYALRKYDGKVLGTVHIIGHCIDLFTAAAVESDGQNAVIALTVVRSCLLF